MIRSVLTGFAIILVLAATTSGQVNFNFTGGGTRAQGMGNAYIALSNDASSPSWNPAGMFAHEKTLGSFAMSSFAPRGDFFNNDFKLAQGGSFSNVSYASFIAPLRVKGHPFVLGISYSRNLEDYQNFGGMADSIMFNAPDDTATISYEEIGNSHGLYNSVNFAFGTRVSNSFTIGAAVNVYTGRGVQSSTSVQTIDSLIPPDKPLQHVLYRSVTNLIDTTTFSGVNFTVGLRRTGERMDLGLIIRTPFSLKYNTGSSIYSVVTYNGSPQGQYSDSSYVEDQLIKYEIPMFVGLGVAYKVKPDWIVAADGEYRAFSGKELKIRDSLRISPSGSNEEFYTSVDPGWKNVFVFRAGTEYVLKTNSPIFPVVPLRAGFGYVPSPWPSFSANGAEETTKSVNLSAGIGVHWTQIYLDAAYTYMSGDYTAGGVKLENRNHQFNFMFTGYF